MSAVVDEPGVDRAARTFSAPPSYVQGPGVFDDLGTQIATHGRRPLIVVDTAMFDVLGERLDATCVSAGVEPQVLPFHGPVTRERIAETLAQVRTDRDVVVGIGGGKALDIAKGVADGLDVPMISVPTVASNDGPTARVYAIYDDAGRLSELGRLKVNPVAVVVDSAIVAAAPIRFLLSGIGDALSKKFEAHSCARGHGLTTQGTRPLIIGEVIADGCYRVLMKEGVSAVADVHAGRITPGVEAVIEAVILLSGVGYENGGLSIAHCMTRGLQVGRGTAQQLHGFHVAYGLAVQLALEDYPADERAEVRGFFSAIGLPTRLEDLGMPGPTESEITELAIAATTAPHITNTWVDASSGNIIAAMMQVEKEAA